MVTLDPNQEMNITFTIHSFHAIGKINYCKGDLLSGIARCIVLTTQFIATPIAAELYDTSGELLDNITVQFETLDTCFCYGHCGCAVSHVIAPQS